MESKLTLEVNINLKADESLQQIVAYVFGQKLTPEHERRSATIEPKPQPAADPEPQPTADPEPQPAAEAEAKPKRARSKKVDPQPSEETADPEPQKPLPYNGEVAAAVEAAAEQGAEAREQVSFEKVRQAFFQKLAGHRDEIRSKINELGAPSLSTIEPAKLPEMLNFLNNLD